MRLQPRADLEHVVDAFRDRAREDDILRDGWRKGIPCRHQETVRLLAREPERQRELDRGAFRHGAERMRYDGAVGAPVNARPPYRWSGLNRAAVNPGLSAGYDFWRSASNHPTISSTSVRPRHRPLRRAVQPHRPFRYILLYARAP